MLSVIVPVYNENDNVRQTGEIISELLEENHIPYEMIFVDDGSNDSTWQIIIEQHKKNEKIKGVSFSRNFGKEAAISAGLSESAGDCAVVIDCDLQHPPKTIIEMYKLWEDGYEVVEGVKSSRGNETKAHSFAAKTFYKVLNRAVGTDMTNSSDFKLLDRKAIDSLLKIKEKGAFFRALSSWIGFKSITVKYEVQERIQGETKWTTSSLIKYALSNIASFTNIPLYIVIVMGVLMFVLGLGVSIQSLVKWATGNALEGFTTVIILQCFSSSIIMISLGVVGYYLSKVYEELKNRPKYIVSRKVGIE